MKIYPITPIPKPRMTRRDKWHRRKPVLQYFAFKDEVKLHKLTLPESGYHVIFLIPMPKSWSKKKREQMKGQPHQQKPDKDNLEKALLDAIYHEDCRVWDGRSTKLWAEEGAIAIREIEPVVLS